MRLIFNGLILSTVLLFGSLKPSNSPVDVLETDKVCKKNQLKDENIVKDLERMNLIVSLLNSQHFAPHPIDNEFSANVFDVYIDRIDYNRRFLIESDFKKLVKYREQLDDQIHAGKLDLFELSHEILEKRISEAQEYYTEILSEPFDFTIDEMVELDPEKLEFAKSEKVLKNYWRKILKYQTLTKLVNRLEKQEEKIANGDTITERSFEELEKVAREKVLKEHDQWFKRLAKLNRADRLNNYFNAITMVYDPHTNFYPPKDKENFDISLSGRLEGIGATLQEEDGYIKVTRIVTGSASWKQGELEAGDLILKVGQADDEPISVVDMRLDDAVKMIRGKKGTEVRLTVKKMDGEETIIPIIRDVVVLEETYAKSAKVEFNNEQYGYIKLPKFYADFSGKGGRSCAKDVEIEVEKLKKEGVDGIIIDLRDNGGGSLRDVVDMAGLFIESGPVVQVKPRRGNPYILPDKNTMVQYDGPLVIMVNSLSASASEILAAAMQDYQRAVIVGSGSTYGKGTVQRFQDLDEYLREDQLDLKPLGAVKYTMQKFYRINGGTTQRTGVIPDIVFPDNYRYIEFGEKEVDHAMPWDEIEALNYPKYGVDSVFIEQIRNQSEARMKSNQTFNLLDERAKRYQRLRDDNLYNLNLEAYRAERKKEKEEGKKFENLMKEPIVEFEITNLQADVQHIESDTSLVARNEDFLKKLKKDVYLFETAKIASDIYSKVRP